MKSQRNYDTVTEAVNDLTSRGYTANLRVMGKFLSCDDLNLHLDPSEFEIDEFYRFEGDSDPGDEMVVYAISSKNKGVKGVLVNAYGTYNDLNSDELVKKLSISRG